MNKLKKITYLLLLVIITSGAWAQNLQFTAQYPEQVYVGEPFQITFSINTARPENFSPPAFKGLQVLFGPSQSSSSNISIINGVRSQNFSYAFTYQLMAEKEGVYRYNGASIFAEGKKHTTSPISIKALPSNKTAQTQPQGGGNQQNQPQTITGDQLYVRAYPNKTSVYMGEEIILNYRLYTAVSVAQYTLDKTPSFNGFWTVSPTSQLPISKKTETINGKTIISAQIYNQSLFPQETGKLNIEPLEIKTIVQIQVPRQRQRSGSIFDFFDDPFFDSYQNIEKTLRSEPLKINVKPLPQENRPLSFNGLVGKYDLNFKYDATKKVKANEVLKFYFTVKGQGNVDLIPAPNIVFPPDFEVYDPQITSSKKKAEGGVYGERTFEFIAIPRHSGTYQIPAFEYSYFNPETGTYVAKTFESFSINIEQGSEHYNATSKVKENNTDIEYLKSKLDDLNIGYNTSIFLKPKFNYSIGGILLIFFILLFAYHKRLKIKADVVGQKNKKAEKLARRYLKHAEKALKQKDANTFYILISQALWGFLSNKFNIPNSLLSVENVRKAMIDKKIDEELIAPFIETIEHCEFERFAPQGNRIERMEAIFSEALNIIIKMAKELKK